MEHESKLEIELRDLMSRLRALALIGGVISDKSSDRVHELVRQIRVEKQDLQWIPKKEQDNEKQ